MTERKAIISEEECSALMERLRRVKEEEEASSGQFLDYFMRKWRFIWEKRKPKDPEKIPLPPERFDVNRFFEAFDKIRMHEGWELDYVYRFSFLAGYPLLYARRKEEPPFLTLADFLKKFPDEDDVRLLPLVDFRWRRPHIIPQAQFLRHLEFELSPQGFFQFVVFCFEVDRFYFFWHACYRDLEVVCTSKRKEELLDEIVSGRLFGMGPREEKERFPPELTPSHEIKNYLTDEEVERIKAFDVRPKVGIKGKSATIEVMLFTKWGGFEKARIKATWPNRFEGGEVETLASFDCGVRF